MRNYIKMRNDTFFFFFFPNTPTLSFFFFFSITEENELAENKISELQTQVKKDALAIATQHKQLEESAARQTALVAEYKDYKDKAEVDIAALKKRISDLEAQLAALSKEHQSYVTSSAATGKEIVQLKSSLETSRNNELAQESTIARYEAQLLQLDNEYKKHLDACGKAAALAAAAKLASDAEIDKLKRQVASLSGSLEASTNRVTQLEAKGKSDQEEISSLKRQLSDAEAGGSFSNIHHTTFSNVQSNTTVNNAFFTGYQKSIQQAEKTISALQAKTKQDTEELSALTKKYIELTSAKALTDKQVEALTAQGGKDALEIATMKKRVSGLDAQVKSITEENELAENQISLLQTQGKTYRVAIAKLTDQGKLDTLEIAALRKQLADLTTAKAATDKEVERLQAQGLRHVDDINKLKQQLAAHQASSSNTIADLQAQLKKKEGVIVDMQKERDRLLAEVSAAARRKCCRSTL